MNFMARNLRRMSRSTFNVFWALCSSLLSINNTSRANGLDGLGRHRFAAILCDADSERFGLFIIK